MRKKILIVLNVFFAILLAYFILNITSEKRAEKLYKQGLAFEQKEDFQNAYYNFSKISFFSKMYSLSLYKQAYNAQSANDEKTALSKYKALLRREKDNELLAPVAYWQIGNIYADQKKDDKAISIFEELQRKFPDSDYSHASNYYLGTLKNDDKSIGFLIEYIKYAPMGRFSKNAIMYLENANQTLSEEEKIILGKAYLLNENYEKSLDILRTCKFENVWIDIAKNYEKLNQYDMAQRTYLMGFGQLTEGSIYTDEDIQSALNSYASYGTQDKKSTWESIINITNTPKNPAHIGAMFQYAAYASQAEASRIYTQIYNEDKNGYYTPSSLAELVYYNYKLGNYNEGIKLSKIIKDNYRYSKAAPKGLFWGAKSSIKIKNKEFAKELLIQIVSDNPDDYYAFRANELLYGKKKYVNNKTKIKKDTGEIPCPYYTKGKNKFYIDTITSLNDISTLNNLKINDKFLDSWLNYNKKRVTYSNTLARDGMEELKEKPDIKDSRWKLVYPIYYSEFINKNAELFNVSPYLILSIIKEESHFDKNAKSPVGALGLMQIMPATAQMVGGNNYDSSKIFEADYNIYLGVKYFASIIKTHRNQETLGVLSYNGGPNAVKKWLDNAKIKDLDEFIEEIPYPETKNYFKKVYSSYYNYLRIYN